MFFFLFRALGFGNAASVNLIVRVQGGAAKHMPVTNIAGRVDLIDYEFDKVRIICHRLAVPR